MRWYLAPLIAVAIFSAAGALPARAQEAVTVRIEAVDVSAYPEVRTTVTILDANGRPIGDLPAQAFTADSDGTAVQVLGVERGLANEVPAAVVLVFDASGSMEGTAIQQARQAGKALVDNLGPNDQVAVLKFADGVEIVHGLTGDRAALTSAIDGIQAAGDTALYDGVVKAAEAVQGSAQRDAVVLMSDGLDAGGVSRTSREASLAAAQAAGAPFFVVGLGDGIDQPYLEELSRLSRGQFLLAPGPDALQSLYAAIGAALRSQYTITLDAAAVDPAVAKTLSVQVSGAVTGVDETPLDLSQFAPQAAQPTPGATPPPATPAPTAVATPIAEGGGGGTTALLAAGLIGAVVVAGGSAATMVWLSRRRRPGDEADVLRSPLRPVNGSSTTANTPIFVGTGPLGLAADADAWLEVVAPDPLGRFPLGEEPVTVGFTGDCTIRLPDGAGHEGSRLRVWRREGRYMLHNLSRLGRVLLAGKPASWAVLEDGDEILIGPHQLVFRDSSRPDGEPADPAAQAGPNR
jgi:VWFA-related protein